MIVAARLFSPPARLRRQSHDAAAPYHLPPVYVAMMMLCIPAMPTYQCLLILLDAIR